jgi:hypothetical protein
VKLLKGIVLGGALLTASQAFAEDDTVTEIRLLKAKLKPLEQRVESQGQKESENHHVADVSFGGHIALEVVPKTLDLTFSAAHGALGRFSAAPFPDATLRQDGSIQLIPLTAVQGGLVWHATPALDLYAYAGLEKVKATFSNVGTVPFGYGNPLYDNRGCNTEGAAASTCNGNTSEVRQITAGFFNTAFQRAYGTVKTGMQYPTPSDLPSRGWEALRGPTTRSS